MTDATSDEILMAAYQAGNETAFTELFQRHGDAVYGFLVRRLGDRALAEDLHQEAFLRLHRARDRYDSSRPFRAWLFAILNNLVNDVARDRLRGPRLVSGDGRRSGEDGEGGAHGSRIEREPAGDQSSPEHLVAAREAALGLDRVLRALPPDEATVLILARFEGMSYDDIATIIGRSATATKQLAYRALKRVRAALEEEP